MTPRSGLTAFVVAVLAAPALFAQTPIVRSPALPPPQQSQGAQQAPGAVSPAPSPMFSTQMENRGGAKLRVLDKITARTSTIDVKVGQSASFAALRITLRACRENPPTEAPESAAFLEIAEHSPEGVQPAFSGWMFASSPALSAMEHAVYDVWVLGCTQ